MYLFFPTVEYQKNRFHYAAILTTLQRYHHFRSGLTIIECQQCVILLLNILFVEPPSILIAPHSFVHSFIHLFHKYLLTTIY